MVAEQTTHSRYWSSAARPPREIDVSARIETPGEPGVDVDTVLAYQPLPEGWDEVIARHVYEAVHAALAAAARPLPDDGLRVLISDLRIAPAPGRDADPAEVTAVAETVRAIVAATVESLWAGLPRDRPAVEPE